MGFDEYIYVVTVIDTDGAEYIYEFGNVKHATEFYKSESNARIEKYKNGKLIASVDTISAHSLSDFLHHISDKYLIIAG